MHIFHAPTVNCSAYIKNITLRYIHSYDTYIHDFPLSLSWKRQYWAITFSIFSIHDVQHCLRRIISKSDIAVTLMKGLTCKHPQFVLPFGSLLLFFYSISTYSLHIITSQINVFTLNEASAQNINNSFYQFGNLSDEWILLPSDITYTKIRRCLFFPLVLSD